MTAIFDIVVAADLDWGIGKTGSLPWPKLKGDFAHFRSTTCAAPDDQRNAVVMGRKTWESAEIARRPLPRRLNIVVTRQDQLAVPEGVVVVRSLDDAIEIGGVHATFVIGGADLYREAIVHPALRWVYLTRIAGRFDCDVAIPPLDTLGFCKIAWDGEATREEAGMIYRIERWAR
jgi:dihydrofolate reductase